LITGLGGARVEPSIGRRRLRCRTPPDGEGAGDDDAQIAEIAAHPDDIVLARLAPDPQATTEKCNI
jgi:hypothetical protein